MRIVCPNCDAEYEVDESAIPTIGRDVQCGSCEKTWFQMPVGNASNAAAGSEPEDIDAQDVIAKGDVQSAEVEDAPVTDPVTDPENEPAPQTATSDTAASASETAQDDDEQFQKSVEAARQATAEKHAADIAAAAALSATVASAGPTDDVEDITEQVKQMASELGTEQVEDLGTETTPGWDQIAEQIHRGVADLAQNSPKSLENQENAPEDVPQERERPEISGYFTEDEAVDVSADVTLEQPQFASLDASTLPEVPAEPTAERPEEPPAEYPVEDPLDDPVGPTSEQKRSDTTLDAVREALAENEETPVAHDEPERDSGLGTKIAGAATGAAAAAIVTMPKPVDGDVENGDSLAERLKAHVAEAARERASGVSPEPVGSRSQIILDNDASEHMHAAARRDSRLPDADNLATSLRGGETARKSMHVGPTTAIPDEGSLFSTGFFSALGLFLIALLIYLFAPQISASLPPVAGVMESYSNSIDGLRHTIAGWFGKT